MSYRRLIRQERRKARQKKREEHRTHRTGRRATKRQSRFSFKLTKKKALYNAKDERREDREDRQAARITSKQNREVTRKIFRERHQEIRKRSRSLRRGTPGVSLTPFNFPRAPDPQLPFKAPGLPGAPQISGTPAKEKTGFFEDFTGAQKQKLALGTGALLVGGAVLAALMMRK